MLLRGVLFACLTRPLELLEPRPTPAPRHYTSAQVHNAISQSLHMRLQASPAHRCFARPGQVSTGWPSRTDLITTTLQFTRSYCSFVTLPVLLISKNPTVGPTRFLDLVLHADPISTLPHPKDAHSLLLCNRGRSFTFTPSPPSPPALVMSSTTTATPPISSASLHSLPIRTPSEEAGGGGQRGAG